MPDVILMKGSSSISVKELVTNPKNVCVLNKDSIEQHEEATCGVEYKPISRSGRLTTKMT